MWYYSRMGRKPIERIAVAFKLPIETVRQIRALSKATGETQTRVVVVAVRNYWRSWQRRKGNDEQD